VRSYWPHFQHPSWKNTACRLSATACSVYSQLLSISGGRLLHPQPEDAPCRGDKRHTWYGLTGNMNIIFYVVYFLRYISDMLVSWIDHCHKPLRNRHIPGTWYEIETSFTTLGWNHLQLDLSKNIGYEYVNKRMPLRPSNLSSFPSENLAENEECEKK
jgi:hypothetical protein